MRVCVRVRQFVLVGKELLMQNTFEVVFVLFLSYKIRLKVS